MDISFRYIMQCRENTFKGITPASTEKYNTPGYKAIINLGKQYIEDGGIAEFSRNFQGDQYFVELWTAHIIFEYGNPDLKLKAQCVEIIKSYSDNPLSPEVSLEELEWLKRHRIS